MRYRQGVGRGLDGEGFAFHLKDQRRQPREGAFKVGLKGGV